MSYNIPKGYRVFANLRKEDHNKGFARHFSFYDEIRKHNGSLSISNPNLNKILEYCAYSHDPKQMPKDLKGLKDSVVDFFSTLYGATADEHKKQNLFAHFLMRECNTKTIPISDTAIRNSYGMIFGGDVEENTILRVSNLNRLYYVKSSPYEFLIDKDQFSDLFEEESVSEDESASEEDGYPAINLYNFLHSDGLETVVTATALKPVILSVANIHFEQKPFTADELISAITADYGITEDVWGNYVTATRDYGKTLFRDKVTSSVHKLRQDGFIKKSANRTNKVTKKGVREYESYLADYDKSLYTILNGISVSFDDTLKGLAHDLCFVIEPDWDANNNNLTQIILCSHYEINIEHSTDNPVELTYSQLVDHICDQYGISEKVWGMYHKNRTVFRKKVSAYKSRLKNNGYLATSGESLNTYLTQKGIELVEQWIKDSQGIVSQIEEDDTTTTETVEETVEDNLVVIPQITVDDPVSIIEMLSEDEISVEETNNGITVLSVSDLEEDNDTDYDQYLRDTLAENDRLSEKLVGMKATVDNLVAFLKEKDLLSEYIVSLNSNTEIPF